MLGRLLPIAVLVACGGSSGDSWHALREHETASLMAVWGASADDVWVVGGRAALGGGPTVLHLEDGAWSRVDTGLADLDLWWVFGFDANDVFFSGTGGTILHYRGGALEPMPTPRTGTIFGMWGAAPDDVWAVGDGGTAGAIVWHYDGAGWTEPPLPAGVPNRVFKVHGQATDDVWISCADGSVLHWQGSALEREVTGVTAPLFSIVTTPDREIAVGGAVTGDIVERAGGTWQVAPFSAPVWRGVAAQGDVVYAVGEDGAVGRRDGDAWAAFTTPPVSGNFHAAFVDPDQGLWGVGGNFDQLPLTTDGFVVHFGGDGVPAIQP